MPNKNHLIRHSLGFLQIEKLPSETELNNYYNQKYFQNEQTQYHGHYGEDEIFNRNLAAREIEFFCKGPGRFADFGCGEGFVLKYLSDLGWDANGFDFTLDGINHSFPELAPKVRAGNLFSSINSLIEKGDKFDLVTANNVLEHVLDPIGLVAGMKKLLKPGGICRLVVPNDSSILQAEVVKQKSAEAEFWVTYPDHLSYFSGESLNRLVEHCGLKPVALLSDFPIDIFLLNPDTNYKLSPEKGKNCFKAKLSLENLVAERSLEGLISFRKGCAAAGIGRNLILYSENPK